MTKRTFLQLLQKKETGRLSAREKALLHQVLDQLQRRELSWDLDREEEAEIQQRIKGKIDRRIQRSRKQAYFSGPVRMVASIALLIGLGFLVFRMLQAPTEVVWEKRSTNERQKATITLPDGSMAYLNTNTTLWFPRQFESGKRLVKLDGEAFFEVVANEAAVFEVRSHGVRTEVLGTRFNVKAHRESAVMVAVDHGSVAVCQQGREEETRVKLHPNQMATVYPEHEEIVVAPVDKQNFLAWKAQSVSFDLVTFDEIIPRLAAIYNYSIDVEGEGMDRCQIKATYRNGNLYAVLHGLKNLADFDIKKTGERKLTLYFKGCNH